jgi:hypothetical protein
MSESTTHQRFYFFDAGLFRALRPAGPLDRPDLLPAIFRA